MAIVKTSAIAALTIVAASAASLAGVGDAAAYEYGGKKLYSYDTKHGAIKFYNEDGAWPVVKKIKSNGQWYRCSFWSSRYDCDALRSAKTYGEKKRGGFGNDY